MPLTESMIESNASSYIDIEKLKKEALAIKAKLEILIAKHQQLKLRQKLQDPEYHKKRAGSTFLIYTALSTTPEEKDEVQQQIRNSLIRMKKEGGAIRMCQVQLRSLGTLLERRVKANEVLFTIPMPTVLTNIVHSYDESSAYDEHFFDNDSFFQAILKNW